MESANYVFTSIHILESLKESDGEPGAKLHARLAALQKPSPIIPVYYYQAVDTEQFFLTLDRVYTIESAARGSPILHFEVHGGPEGFQLRDDSIVTWDIFSERLWRFNLASQFNLLAVFSCCDGLHQIDALSTDKPCPFATLVGCEGKLSTQELLNGFQCFYAELMASGQAQRALTALQAQILQSTARFRFFSAEYAFLRVASRVLSDNANPVTFEREARFIRTFVQRLFARRGIRQSVSLRDAQDAVRASQRSTLPQFFETFFAIDQIPGNRVRFNYERLRALAESKQSVLINCT